MNLHGNTKSKITKNKNGQNVPHLKVTEVVLVHCNIVPSDYQQNSIVLYTFFFLINPLVNYWLFHLKI